MNDSTIDGQLLALMLRGGSRWILWLLIALSVAALAVAAERIWFFVRERVPTRRLAVALQALHDGNVGRAISQLSGQRSMAAAVARACLEHAAASPSVLDDHRIAAVERARLRYEHRLAFLGTLGNNAPFIGLFGTVLGIIRAFHDLAASSLAGTQVVMSGIAEALVATGVGLLVALPSVALYNGFARHIEATTSHAEATVREMLAVLRGDAEAASRRPLPFSGAR